MATTPERMQPRGIKQTSEKGSRNESARRRKIQKTCPKILGTGVSQSRFWSSRATQFLREKESRQRNFLLRVDSKVGRNSYCVDRTRYTKAVSQYWRHGRSQRTQSQCPSPTYNEGCLSAACSRYGGRLRRAWCQRCFRENVAYR